MQVRDTTNRTGAIVKAVLMPESGTKNRVCRLSEGVTWTATPLSLRQNVDYGPRPASIWHKSGVSRVLWGVKDDEGRSVAAPFTRFNFTQTALTR